MPNPVAPVVDLTEEERSQLLAWSRRSTSANGLAMRSRIVLAAAEGMSNTAIADKLDVASPSGDEDEARTASQMGLVAAPEQTSDLSSGSVSARGPLRSLLQTIRTAIPKLPAPPQPQAKSAVAPDAAPQTDQTEPKGNVADSKRQAQPVDAKAPDVGRHGQQTKADDSGSGAQDVGKHSQTFNSGSTSNTAVRSGAGKHRADNGIRGAGWSAKKQRGGAGGSSHRSGGSPHKGGK